MPDNDASAGGTTSPILLVFSWLVVILPLLWGVWETIKKAAALFR